MYPYRLRAQYTFGSPSMAMRPNGGEQSIGADLLNSLGTLSNLEYPALHLLGMRINHKDMRCPKRHEIGDALIGIWSNENPEAGCAVRRWLLYKACYSIQEKELA